MVDYVILTQLLWNCNRAVILVEVLRELPCAPREAPVPGEDFVAVGKLCHGLTNFPLEGGREGAHYTHPPLCAGPGCCWLPPETSGLGTGNEGSSTMTRQRLIMSITQSRENKPFISVCHQLEDGMVGFASQSCRLPRPRPRAFAGLGSLSLPRISCSLRFSGSSPVVAWILLPTWPRL